MIPVLLLPIVAAFARGDHDEVARQAGQLGAAGLAPLLDTADADAAIAAAPDAPDAYELLPDLARVASRWDRARAAPAARAAARIADSLDDAGEHDVPDDVLATAQAQWSAIAARTDRWADVRVHALEVAAHVARARHAGLGYDLAAMLADPDPELRRAAAELVPAPLSDDDRKALAAAQVVCADLASDPPAPILAALGAQGLGKLRTLANALPPDVSAAALVDAARCLAADDDPTSAKALRAMRAAIAKRRR